MDLNLNLSYRGNKGAINSLPNQSQFMESCPTNLNTVFIVVFMVQQNGYFHVELQIEKVMNIN